MSIRPRSGGDARPDATLGNCIPNDSLFISTYTPLPRSEFAQAMLDILCLLVWMVLGVLGVAVVGGPVIVVMWMLLFS